MKMIFQFVAMHGYSVLFAAVFGRQIGLPIPAPLFLIAAGALAASHKLGLIVALCLAVIACVLADWAWYEAGRQWGDRILHFIHRFSSDPEGADRHSRKTFAQYGPPLLVLAKFVPGLDAVAPPLAGRYRTSRVRFLSFETTGAGLWASAYAGLGYLFSQQLEPLADCVTRVGTSLALLALAGVLVYATSKLVRGNQSMREYRLARKEFINGGE